MKTKSIYLSTFWPNRPAFLAEMPKRPWFWPKCRNVHGFGRNVLVFFLAETHPDRSCKQHKLFAGFGHYFVDAYRSSHFNLAFGCTENCEIREAHFSDCHLHHDFCSEFDRRQEMSDNVSKVGPIFFLRYH